jgi:chromate transporter
MPATSRQSDTSLGELARLFLKLGIIGFGGPAAHIALMEDEVVGRRGWLTREQFLDYVGATNLIPGPNSTELAIEIGRSRAGLPGLVVAGACFIAPAALIVGAIAWVYIRFGQLAMSVAVLAGVKPVVIAVVLQALYRLTRAAVKNVWLAALAVAAITAAALGVHELIVLLGAGLVCCGAVLARTTPPASAGALLVPALHERRSGGRWLAALGIASTGAAAISIWQIFAIFLKIGSVLFGSGYVLLAFLRADFVQRLGWLTERQLLDAVAVGQVTPGPVFTTATFVGYVLAGFPGAVVATLGIFLPAFIFVAISGPFIPRLRQSRALGAALDGVNAASLALMALVTWQLGRAAIVDVPTALLALGAFGLLVWRRVNVAWLILGGGLVGVALATLR